MMAKAVKPRHAPAIGTAAAAASAAANDVATWPLGKVLSYTLIQSRTRKFNFLNEDRVD
jgi:hypothetical protein